MSRHLELGGGGKSYWAQIWVVFAMFFAIVASPVASAAAPAGDSKLSIVLDASESTCGYVNSVGDKPFPLVKFVNEALVEVQRGDRENIYLVADSAVLEAKSTAFLEDPGLWHAFVDALVF